MAFTPSNLVVVGAGFSKYAELPLATEFTEQLLNLAGLKLDGPSNRQVAFIRRFVSAVFGEGAERQADEWPDLEDIFTMVDLSANTGHHLGTEFSASDLRLVRRSIIVRTIRMLSQAYKAGQRKEGAKWRTLEDFFTRFDLTSSAVLSMNWDTVFEAGVSRTQGVRAIDYGCHAVPYRFEGNSLRKRPLDKSTQLHLLKPHGSTNWLYCDACRETAWVSPSDTEKVAKTLFRKSDWTQMGTKGLSAPSVLSPNCPHCGAESLGTRFATFSYRKALDFPMHSASWRTAEQYLKDAVDWVFVGYSMPAADFEFKHLLKRVQLTERTRPVITVITGGAGAETTEARYRKFFGEVAGERFFFRGGLDAAAMAHLERRQVLKPA